MRLAATARPSVALVPDLPVVPAASSGKDRDVIVPDPGDDDAPGRERSSKT